MFRTLFIANRGEVAARVLRTARRMGIRTHIAASPADRDLRFLGGADRVLDLPGNRSYLDQTALLASAEGCAAVHPGWGFLSENPTFAARCEAQRLSFVGPRSPVMRQMADKAEARATMKAQGVLPIPGSDGPVATVDEARAEARRMGYPVLLKALAGGGGRGMRRVYEDSELEAAFQQATAEAASAFGDGRLYLEKLILGGRHIEFQILGDGRGHAIHLRERECSVQRRHQKLLEETPSPVVSREQADLVGDRVARACAALRYRGAGTIEMLRDADGNLWFMEMNTRLQVEHPITEAITGVDLVQMQLEIAANHDLTPAPRFDGHAIECRINAEDPAKGFQPTPGKVTRLVLPEGEGIRVDTHLAEGDAISPHYDSMFCKVIAHATTRDLAIERMERALRAMDVQGVSTTIPLHLEVLADPRFRAGTYDTSLLDGRTR